jgi:hypothetical protein
MPDKAMSVVLGAAESVVVAVASRAATVDLAVSWGRGQWWARWLP